MYIFIDIHIQIHIHMYILTHYIYGIVLWIGHFLSRAEVPRPPRIFASRDGALAAASFCSLSGGSRKTGEMPMAWKAAKWGFNGI
jgi:hypothetical protein